MAVVAMVVAAMAAAAMAMAMAMVAMVAEATASGLPECMCAFASHRHRVCRHPLNHQQCRSKRTHSS
eukprot:scaffold94603_cov105-Phaeocystis_antarctica.AAC.2